MSNWHSMEVAHVLKELGTDQHQGLSGEEVKRRLEKYGYNEINKEGAPASSPARFSNRLKSILAALLFIAAVLSVVGPPILGTSMTACLKNWYPVLAQVK